MKTKFKSLILLLAIVPFFMTSCSDDEIDDITLSESSLNLSIGESKIVAILTGNGDYIVSSNDITTAVVVHEKKSDKFTVTGVKEGETSISILDGENQSKTLTVKVKGLTNPLETAQNFTLTYTGSNQSDGKNINATVGIKWAVNTTSSTSTFRVEPTSGNKFVMLDATRFNAIDTKEALEAAYVAGAAAGVSEYSAKQDAKFEQIYFISKVGDTYFKINQKDLSTTGAGTTGSTSNFSYQK